MILSNTAAARALVSPGDDTRLREVFARARRGEPITLAAIGGSITAGARATQPENRYVTRLAGWWLTAFPDSPLKLVNAGIGATGSNYGALRLQRDVLSKNPDLVIVDFAVNDLNDPAGRAESYEGVIRQLLAHRPQPPAVVLVFFLRNDGANAQQTQIETGRHYQVPMISIRDAVWPEITAGRLTWNDYAADYVHPNDAGHALIARRLIEHFERVQIPASPAFTPPSLLPAPLHSNLFQDVTLHESSELYPVSNNGWVFDTETKAWIGRHPGDTIEFEITGIAVFLMDYHKNGGFGRASVQVDSLPPVTRETWYEQTWGGYRDTVTIARDLSPGPHRIKLKILPDHHSESGGHEFRLLGLGAANPLSGEP
ncbi:hypothetical protein OPIT5_05820 [Opitutaceae bacterium TAV5]|nr:hypothetical protein OPIT5_05820 [Opitutaceae bacterium TAV5]